tara:strand:+ start:17521 stop:19578 length:2058 start_codon:yes stop_codon:yes gene_type:complete
MEVSLGHPRPLGAHRLPNGQWNFAVFSQHAKSVEVCLFRPRSPHSESARFSLKNRTGSVWHGAVSGLKPGQLYGLRVDGEWNPSHGHRFNPHKLLLDPYARALSDQMRDHRDLCNPGKKPDEIDSASVMPKCVLVDDSFDWEGDQPLNIPWNQTIIYETHVVGLTKQFPGLSKRMRGTYAGLAHDKVIRYLKDLGITTVQLMPVHHHIDDGFLQDRRLTNYWGYQTVGFFAPESRYSFCDPSKGDHVKEFKRMVKKLHQHGLEVILDVVYNHTGEMAPQGPTTSFRGLDNHSYYRLEPRHPEHYRDFTGCGNTVDVRHPYVLQLITDSLRYWVEEMHVDGFRFDLAASLGRESDGFTRENGFFRAIHQDPVLSQTKLIAEPWDLGPGGYQVGGFPEGWSELNGKYRDCMRRFWNGDPGLLPEFASRLSGSEDHYAASRRAPQCSVNFLTSHDGFTLKDLVSYNEKHNLANGEENRDGDMSNHSQNHGYEGETDDPAILDARDQHRRNLVSTLFLSLGTPFLLGGDERGRSQGGNNNAYCQDNEISWFDWKANPRDQQFFNFVKRLIQYRKQRPELIRKEFYHGGKTDDSGVRDLVWYDFEGVEMEGEAWSRGEIGGRIQALIHDEQLLIFNACHDPGKVHLPGEGWRQIVDTTKPEGFLKRPIKVESPVFAAAFSLHVFERGALA